MKDIVIFLWMILFLIGLLFFYRFCLWIRSIRLEKRIVNYTVLNQEQSLSVFDKIESRFHSICKQLAKTFTKCKMFQSYSKSYYSNGIYQDGYLILASKFILGIGFGFFSLLISILFSLEEIFFITIGGILIGYLIPDIMISIHKIKNKRRVEKDLVKALTIMNHSFMAGKSIMQAIETVAEEIDGPLHYEFYKMKTELMFGLDLETVLERFYERMPLDDIRYLTTSLIVFNKTGGNIVTIFRLIEKNYYTRMELKKELEATTASARLVYRLLMILPIFMVVVITFLDSSYFMILFTNILGILLLIGILIIYIVYILIIKKLLKIEYK